MKIWCLKTVTETAIYIENWEKETVFQLFYILNKLTSISKHDYIRKKSLKVKSKSMCGVKQSEIFLPSN